MDSSNGKRSDRDAIAESWGTCKLRSPRKRVGPRHVEEEPDGATSDSDMSESESEGLESESEGSESECEGSRSSRSSARHASSVMAKFCEAKRKAVSEIGFGGVLQLALVNKVNLKFTAWLFSRIDLKTRSMPVGSDGSRVYFCPEHVEKVIGVASRGRQVCGLEPDDAQERSDFVRLAMGATQFCGNPLKAAQSVVTRQWKDGVTPGRVDEFKVAFVVWINGRFLAPTTKQDLGHSDFWGALYNTDEIVEYNWGAYYLEHMMGAAARVQDDIKHRRGTMFISSCPLLAQMIYLDNIELGILSKPHSVFPRIIDFDSGTLINKMIKADMLHKPAGQGDPSWGASRARRHEDSCYMASQKGQSSPSRVRRPGKELENSVLVDGRTVGPSFSPAILRPVNASDFYEFLRLGYPDMMDSELVDHLKFHNARCILHSNIFKDSIIRENMRLAARLLDKHKQQKQSSALPLCREDYMSAEESEKETDNKRRRLNMKTPLACENATPAALKQLDPSARRSASRWPNIPGSAIRSSTSYGAVNTGKLFIRFPDHEPRC